MAEPAPVELTPDEYVQAVGRELGTSGWVVIDQDRIDSFAAVTGDDQWIHVDPVRAADSVSGSTIAHGYLTLSLLPAMVREVYRVSGLRLAVNYGLEQVRFPAPLPSGSRVRARVRLVSVDRTGEAMRAEVEATIEREGGNKPVCVARTVSLLFVEEVSV